MTRFVFLLVVLPLFAIAAENRDTKVLNDRSDVLSTGKWIYNDLSKGLDEARRTGKPLLVVLRCVP
jgi:serine protease Do